MSLVLPSLSLVLPSSTVAALETFLVKASLTETLPSTPILHALLLQGFARAICSSRLVVIVMSKKTFVMDGRHNVETLKEASPCDNVLLEYALSLALNETKGTAILPLFVGDMDSKGNVFSHFFECDGMPNCPDIVVSEIFDKAAAHLVQHVASEQQSLTARSIKQILADISEFQVPPHT